MERLALAARVAAARHDYDRAAILLGQVKAHSRRFDAAAARWIRARMDAAMAEVEADMKPEQFAAGMAYGAGIGGCGGR